MHIFTSWSTEQCLICPAHTFIRITIQWNYKHRSSYMALQKSRLDKGECTTQTVVVWHYQCEDVMDKATKLKWTPYLRHPLPKGPSGSTSPLHTLASHPEMFTETRYVAIHRTPSQRQIHTTTVSTAHNPSPSLKKPTMLLNKKYCLTVEGYFRLEYIQCCSCGSVLLYVRDEHSRYSQVENRHTYASPRWQFNNQEWLFNSISQYLLPVDNIRRESTSNSLV